MNVTTAATAASGTTTQSPSSTASLTSSSFMTLLVAELQNQDPLTPMSNEEMLTQLSQITSVNQLTELNTNFKQMAQSQNAGQLAGLLGHTVEYTDTSSGSTLTGSVSRIEYSDSAWALRVGDSSVQLSDVISIK